MQCLFRYTTLVFPMSFTQLSVCLISSSTTSHYLSHGNRSHSIFSFMINCFYQPFSRSSDSSPVPRPFISLSCGTLTMNRHHRFSSHYSHVQPFRDHHLGLADGPMAIHGLGGRHWGLATGFPIGPSTKSFRQSYYLTACSSTQTSYSCTYSHLESHCEDSARNDITRRTSCESFRKP